MQLNDDVELLDGLPVIFIKSIDSLVIADPHLGYEGVMAKKGVLIPKVNLKHICTILDRAIKATKAKTLIVDGDIKNEFSTVDEEEFNELYDFINFAKERQVSLVLIKGNHDNFVERYRDAFKLQIYGQEADIGGYLFFHGEELPIGMNDGTKMLVMGHEHPAISIFNEVGKREKLRCFLYGKFKGKDILVLPAINYFASGTDINAVPEDELLAPIFERLPVGEMRAIAIGYGSTIDFGTISELKRAIG
ncbi:MAG: metallophosphoesterase [Candidatus Marsarchaeota archaeon]|jgi:putative SbcD/Mre11-related phosphoesterase|nr:metallophosphoesterase [Candidatus Marsarchaeota archaeon]MCL5111426.1 metallophosphoesterase [Candidatus Marsarchaeota archaeon]